MLVYKYQVKQNSTIRFFIRCVAGEVDRCARSEKYFWEYGIVSLQ